MTASIDVKSSSGIYSYTVGSSVFEEKITAVKQSTGFDTCFILVDENVWKFHSERITRAFDAIDVKYTHRVIPSGEQSKTVQKWDELVDFLLRSGVRRNTPLFAIGGGVTGDLAGFVAASTLRGIPLVHVPTTLLAMVDSSIGGKTGVNHATGKNLIGSFYQPQEVIADVDFLDTLPHRDWTNGLSEILKYGAIHDHEIFEESEIFRESNVLDSSAFELKKLILKCAKIKADIVAADEFESGTRAFLNFGHTFAHALEKVSDFDLLNHGEAVYLGMLAAITLSGETGAPLDDEPIRKFRSLYSFKVTEQMLPEDALLTAMKSDKKVIDDTCRFVLLKSWQQPEVMSVNEKELIHKAWLTVYHELQ
jgi:3-dehydroquinate synthase